MGLGMGSSYFRDFTHPTLRAPLSCRFSILGEPQNKNAAPWRGIRL
jgi:hypothetical protein